MENIKLKVLGSNILIKKINQQKFGSLLLPENSSDNFIKGIVVGLGNGKKDAKGEIIDFFVKIGDEILFSKHKGNEIIVDETSYLVLPQEEVIGILIK
jgi:co-chaperonin GroES (HSP10)